MHWPCPDDSKKIGNLHVSLMVLEIIYLTLFMRVGIKLTPELTLNVVRCIALVLTIIKRYDNCRCVSWNLEIIYLTLFMRVGIK